MKPRIARSFRSFLFVARAAMAGVFFFAVQNCGGKTPTPGQVVNAVVTCTNTVCTSAATSPECAQLEASVMSCIISGGNLAVCLAGLPSLVGVGYADVVCIIAELANPPATGRYKSLATDEVRQKAADWLKAQHVTIQH
jgi:predicted cation transporter